MDCCFERKHYSVTGYDVNRTANENCSRGSKGSSGCRVPALRLVPEVPKVQALAGKRQFKPNDGVLMIHVLKNTKRVFRPKTQFPSRPERGRLFKRFAVSSLRCVRVGKLLLVVETSPAPDTNGGTSPVMAYDENPHDVANDAKQEMIREALQVLAAKITLANREGFRSLRGLPHVMSQLRRKIHGRAPASQSARSIP